MAETESVKISKSLDKETDKSVKNGGESINDSGIEMNEEKEKMEINVNLKCPWILGQLTWARGSSYPFWPCVVTLDPKTLLYFKVQNKGRSQVLMVHVQYFGDGGRHNWVLSQYIIPFSGLEDFQARGNSLTQEMKKKDSKLAAAFSPKLGVKKQWGIGVTEAAGLMHLSNEERASIFEPVIIPVQKTQLTNNKLKRKLSSTGSNLSNDAPTPDSKKVKKNENEEQISISEPASLPIPNLSSESTSVTQKKTSDNVMTPSRRKSSRNQNKNVKETVETPKRQNLGRKSAKLTEEEKNRRDEIDFEDYCNLNKGLWKADHPNATDEEILKLLRELWDDMDAEEKSNNLNRNFDDYRYNFTGKVKRTRQATLQQEKEKSKNTKNSQQGSNKIAPKLNGQKLEENGKNITEKEKNIVEKEEKGVEKEKNNVEKEKSIVEKEKSNTEKEKSIVEKEKNITEKEKNITEKEKSTDQLKSPQKDNKENDQDNVNLLKEKNKIFSGNGDLQNSKKEETSKMDDTVQIEKTEEIKKKSNSSETSKKTEEIPIKEANEEKKKEKIDGKGTQKA